MVTYILSHSTSKMYSVERQVDLLLLLEPPQNNLMTSINYYSCLLHLSYQTLDIKSTLFVRKVLSFLNDYMSTILGWKAAHRAKTEWVSYSSFVTTYNTFSNLLNENTTSIQSSQFVKIHWGIQLKSTE